MRKMFRVGAAVVLLFAAMGFFSLLERHMIFFPTRYPEGEWDVERHPTDVGPVPWIKDCSFPTSDGLTLHGWFAGPHENGKPIATRFVLLWFHGNAGNLTDRYDHLKVFIRIPIQVFIIDYRGYGKSDGSPSEEGLYRDADAAWSFLLKEKNFKPEQIILFGESLGGAVAVDLASRVKPAALILQSTFTSVPDMAAHHYPFIPRFLIRTRMDSLSKIARVRCPMLILHGAQDDVVPIALDRRLFEAAPQPKEFCEIAGAGHNDMDLVGGEAYLECIRAFSCTMIKRL